MTRWKPIVVALFIFGTLAACGRNTTSGVLLASYDGAVAQEIAYLNTHPTDFAEATKLRQLRAPAYVAVQDVVAAEKAGTSTVLLVNSATAAVDAFLLETQTLKGR